MMTQSKGPTYSIAELAELGGVSRRTVRYYVQRGLLQAPTGTGRGKHYTREHLDRLLEVRAAQEAGASLSSLLARFHCEEAAATARPEAMPLAQSAWIRIVIEDGIELHLQRQRSLDSNVIAALTAALREALED